MNIEDCNTSYFTVRISYEKEKNYHFNEFSDDELLEKLEPFLKKGFSPNECEGNLLLAAVDNNFPKTAKMLLDYGADPDGRYSEKEVRFWEGREQKRKIVLQRECPLCYAARNGNVEMCKLLMAYGANVFGNSISPETPLSRALRAEHKDVAKFLFDEMKKQRLISLKQKHEEEIKMLQTVNKSNGQTDKENDGVGGNRYDNGSDERSSSDNFDVYAAIVAHNNIYNND